MFEKIIESVFTDPHGGQAETDKHRATAETVLGKDPLPISSTTTGVLDDKGLETIGYKLTTRWRSR